MIVFVLKYFSNYRKNKSAHNKNSFEFVGKIFYKKWTSSYLKVNQHKIELKYHSEAITSLNKNNLSLKFPLINLTRINTLAVQNKEKLVFVYDHRTLNRTR